MNTPKVAREHSPQVTEEHFKRASKCASATNCRDSNRAEPGSANPNTTGVAAERCNPLRLQGVAGEWAGVGSNHRPHPYQGCALAN